MRRRAVENSDERVERPSKSARKREVEAINRLGERLTQLKPDVLAALDLDERLLEAIETCAPLKRSARNRQIKLIGKLLRGLDHEAVREALEGTNGD